jgi:hypothetical protein
MIKMKTITQTDIYKLEQNILFIKVGTYKGYKTLKDETTTLNIQDIKLPDININNIAQTDQNPCKYFGETVINFREKKKQEFYERINKLLRTKNL